MKAKDFRALLAELGVSVAQRSATLCWRGPSGLSQRSEWRCRCGRSRPSSPRRRRAATAARRRFSKWGVATGKWQEALHVQSLRTHLQRSHRARRWAHLQKEWLRSGSSMPAPIVHGLSLRKAAKRVGVHLGTSFRWRHRFQRPTSGGAKASAVTGIVEADETFDTRSRRRGRSGARWPSAEKARRQKAKREGSRRGARLRSDRARPQRRHHRPCTCRPPVPYVRCPPRPYRCQGCRSRQRRTRR